MAIISEALVKPKVQGNGIIVGSMWKNKVGFGIRFKAKVKGSDGKFTDIKDVFQFKPGESLLVIENTRKRDGRKDPDYLVIAYPDNK